MAIPKAQSASIMPVASIVLVSNKTQYKSTQTFQYSTGGAAGLSANSTAASSISPTTFGSQVVGDYRINLQGTPAKGWYEWQNGQLVWVPPATNTNIHLEVPLLEAQCNNRPLPDAKVIANIYNQNNALVDSKPMIMLWSPKDYHYGNNFTIPCAGNYTVRIQVTPPQFARQDINLGKKFSQPACATFTNVKLTPLGQCNT
jgi:hypothetical protein